MRVSINQTTIELIEGDITKLETDAIVNAANERLAHGGGVAAAISRAGGPVIQRESNQWVRKHGRVPKGSAAITAGGKLKADYVIHAVGPVYSAMSRSEAAGLLASAVRSALRMAEDNGLGSIALPAISTGIFGYPMDEAASVMLKEAVDCVASGSTLKRIVFCLYGHSAFTVFKNQLKAQLEQIP